MFVYPLQSLQTPKSLLVGISKQWQYLLSLKYLLIYLLPFVLIRSTNVKKAYSPIPTNAIIIILPTTDSILIYFSFILYTTPHHSPDGWICKAGKSSYLNPFTWTQARTWSTNRWVELDRAFSSLTPMAMRR